MAEGVLNTEKICHEWKNFIKDYFVKFHPVTCHEAPEGEQRYRSTLSLTSALDGGGWSTSGPSLFTPRKDPAPIV
jgi:hypothetical protein